MRLTAAVHYASFTEQISSSPRAKSSRATSQPREFRQSFIAGIVRLATFSRPATNTERREGAAARIAVDFCRPAARFHAAASIDCLRAAPMNNDADTECPYRRLSHSAYHYLRNRRGIDIRSRASPVASASLAPLTCRNIALGPRLLDSRHRHRSLID